MVDYLVFFGLILSSFIIFYMHNPRETSHPQDMEFRKCESPIERRLYRALRHNGYQLETQVPCGPYRIDLVLRAYKIAIECDGKLFHSSVKQREHDRRKNAYLRKSGWKVMRFSGRQINNKMSLVLYQIEKEVNVK